MRCRSLAFLLLSAACATPVHLVATRDDRALSVDELAAACSTADVVALGEVHGHADVHRTHLALVQALQARLPAGREMVLALEMFERDTQEVLLEYLAGYCDEGTFLAGSRPWENYRSDYRPLIEFAKQHGVVVLAANAPRALAQRAKAEGVAAVLGSPLVARETTAPEDEYWDRFQAAMQGNGGLDGADALHRYYAAQCLKDDTMAETVVDFLGRRGAQLSKADPLVVLIAGHQHTDHGLGTVARIRSRAPALDVRVVAVEVVADPAAGEYAAPATIGDFVVVVGERPESAPVLARALPMTSTSASATPAASAPAPSAPPASADTTGLRPALGLQPDYDAQDEGVKVGAVRPGGPAEKAGLEAGDVITGLAGAKVVDMATYTEVLDRLRIGSTVSVKVRRGEAEVLLQIQVGSRSASR